MFKKILGTLTTRVLIAGITFLVVMINTNVLGSERLGAVVQLVLAVSVIQLAANILGGPALVYLAPREKISLLVFPSWIWSVVISAAGAYLLDLFETTRADRMMLHVFLLSVLLSLSTINQMILMGKERIKEYNIVTVAQVIVLLVVLLLMYFAADLRDTGSYVTALYFSYGSAFVISFLMIIPFLKNNTGKSDFSGILRQMFNYGGTMQVANIFQFLNYRMSYFIVFRYLGKGPLGIFSVGTSLSESLWILAKSISTVQYSRISNQDDEKYAARITLTFIKICFIVTLAGLLVLLGLLFLLFPLIFPHEFAPVKYVMAILSAGILTFSVSVVLSPYFSGMGKPVHNTITSAIGLVCTLGLGLLLIPYAGLPGAALTATASYVIATAYQFFVFIKKSGLRPADFMLRKSEFRTAYTFFISLRQKGILNDTAA